MQPQYHSYIGVYYYYYYKEGARTCGNHVCTTCVGEAPIHATATWGSRLAALNQASSASLIHI